MMKKRILSLLLCVALAASLTATALAAEPRLPDVGEVVLVEEPGAEEPAQVLADAQADYVGAAEALRKGIAKGETRVYDLKEYHIPADKASLDKLYHYLKYRYGELFAFVGGSFSRSGEYLNSFAPKYALEASDYAAARDFYNRELDAIVAQVPAGATPAQKVLFIHDYLAAHYEYDYRAEPNYDAYSFLQEGKGVCQAYMLVFSALMDKLGIPVSYVESDNLNHAWNVVRLDGKWYHVDVTWDDPTIDGADILGAAQHDYFLLSDATNDARRQARGAHDKDYVCGEDYIQGKRVVTCSDKTYETGFCAAADSPAVYLAGNDSWYYLSTDAGDQGFYRWTEAEGSVRLGDYSTAYSEGVAPLVEYEGSLFFASPDAICRYEPATDTMTTLFTKPDADTAPLSGIQIENGVLSYKLRRTGEMVAFDGELLPWHDVGDGAFSYYSNFGAVGLKPGNKGQVFAAWYDSASGRMTELAEATAEAGETFGTPVVDKDLICAIFVLSTDGTLTPAQGKFVVHDVSIAPAE